MPFAGKSVLITGAGSGIGRAASLLFAKSRARVAINNVSLQKRNEVMELIKGTGIDIRSVAFIYIVQDREEKLLGHNQCQAELPQVAALLFVSPPFS